MKNRRRMFLIDPTLRVGSGHNLDYARQVVVEASHAGFDCSIYAHRFPQLQGLKFGCEIVPWFSRGRADLSARDAVSSVVRRTLGERAYKWLRGLKKRSPQQTSALSLKMDLAEADAFVADTRRLLKEIKPTPDDRLFFPNLTWTEAVRLAEALGSDASTQNCDVHILLRFDPPSEEIGGALLKRAGQVTGIHWLCDTSGLAKTYGNLLGTAVRRAKVPINGPALRKAAQARPKPDPVIVLVLGEARREKGFHMLPDLIGAVIAADPNIEFRVQAALNMPLGEPGIAAALSRLRGMRGKNLQLLAPRIETEEFYNHLGRGHIMLLPYDAETYSMRSSGLLLQALAAGLRIVGPASSNSIASCVAANDRSDQATLCDASIEAFTAALAKTARLVRENAPPPREQLPEELQPTPWADPQFGKHG